MFAPCDSLLYGGSLKRSDMINFEAESHQWDQQSKSFFNSDMLGILIGNPAGMVINANDYFLDLVGYTHDEMKRGELSWINITAPEDVDFVKQNVKNILQDRKTRLYEKEYIHKSGRRIQAMVALTALDDGNAIGVILDISQHKASQLKIEKSRLVHAENQRLELAREQIAREAAEARARQFAYLSDLSYSLSESFDSKKNLTTFCKKTVEFISDLIIVDILDESRQEINIVEMAGLDPKDVDFCMAWRQKNPFNWRATEGPPKVLRTGVSEILNSIDLRTHLEKVFDVKTTSEERTFVMRSLMLVPIKVRDQAPLGLVSFISKNGEFTPADLSLAEDIVNRLSVTLERCRLYDKAQEASRAKSAFLANVSHEIRTPLGAMLGYAEILSEDSELNQCQKNTLLTIFRNGKQLLRIVDEILDISKVESERIQIERIPFSLRDLLEDVVSLMRGKADEKGIELIATYKDFPSHIISDPTRLRQILLNVIGNAVKFTDKGTVELTVERNDHLEFRVTDTGVGISPEAKNNLFQPFLQADSSTTRRFGGTGLGLFLAKKLAHLLGGDLTIEKSVPGQGSIFLVTLPVSVAPFSNAPSLGPGTQRASYDFAGIPSILVVDDVPDNRELFTRLLMRMGVKAQAIDTAKDGSEAVAKALQNKPSIVLMDIQMPGMDGYQALHELKRQQYQGKIIALTAHAMKGDRERCISEGFDAYLQKPLSKEPLQQALIDMN